MGLQSQTRFSDSTTTIKLMTILAPENKLQYGNSLDSTIITKQHSTSINGLAYLATEHELWAISISLTTANPEMSWRQKQSKSRRASTLKYSFEGSNETSWILLQSSKGISTRKTNAEITLSPWLGPQRKPKIGGATYSNTYLPFIIIELSVFSWLTGRLQKRLIFWN